MIYNKKKNKSIESDPEMIYMMESADKKIKTVIVIMNKYLKEDKHNDERYRK